ncbi:unnamed protein product [Coregonus sp. 'balchen']|nr:unnamed protein product [Coregonus sp. 'balchen']
MADRMKLNEKNGVVDKQRENVAKTSSCKEISSYRDNIFILLNLLTDFGSELKLGEAALKISTSLEAVDVTSLQPTHHVFTCLQKHISKLQSVSDNLRVLLEAEGQSSSSKSNKDETITTVSSDEEMTIDSDPMLPAAQPTRPEVEEEGKLQVDDLSVQIRATKSEIDRRISAFIERKQLEINENNVREFCNVIDCNQEDSCARTDAVFTPYPGFKSHVKGGGVGGGALGEAEEQQRAMVSRDCGNPAIEERLHNIETHLKLPTEGPVPLSVYQRLKKLEDRILDYLHKRPKTSMSQACSLSELDVKISAVKAALLKRMGEFGPVAYDTECPL